MKALRFLLTIFLACSVVHLGCGSGEECNPNHSTICKEGVTFWVDSCGHLGDVAGSCECGCNADFTACKDPCECVPACDGLCCGDNGCDGICPDTCSETDQVCNTTTCVCEGVCQPQNCQDLGKECGSWDDGCSGTADCGNCPLGEFCNPSGQCEAGCEPNCEGKQCGDDGCGGECGTCDQGWACSNEGLCVEAACGGDPFGIIGSMQTDVSPVSFDRALVVLVHKRDIDEFEDGCISIVGIALTYGTGCLLELEASGRYIWEGGLAIQALQFTADSFCPNFPDPTEGAYVGAGGMLIAEVVPGVTEVPGYNVEESCVSTSFTIRLAGIMQRVGDQTELVISPTEIVVSGEFLSLGNTGVSCPCLPDCLGRECGPDGCGSLCGICLGVTDYCTSDGECIDDCAGRVCGPSPNAGYDCGSCTGATEYCTDSGACVDDCEGRVCGPSPVVGYNCGTCPGSTEYCTTTGLCIDDCAGRECGISPDAGFWCGDCGLNEDCINWACECTWETCLAECCGLGEVCYNDACCLPDCVGRNCGDDTCGGSCGTCTGPNITCVSGVCTCDYAQCGGTCCDDGEVCDGSTCCMPACAGMECGDNGCGGVCGTCPGAHTCQAGICVGLDWSLIVGGTYNMGSPAGVGDPDEEPMHQVTLGDFEITMGEITVTEYQACIDASACTQPVPYNTNAYCNWGKPGDPDYPVNCVSWFQAVDYCTWVGGRLPSESEWEYAAKSEGMDITYPWGMLDPDCLIACMSNGDPDDPLNWGCGTGYTLPICGFPLGTTVQGLCDMGGNVAEYVQDWHHHDYVGAPDDGSAWEVQEPGWNQRVIRGGALIHLAHELRAADRDSREPNDPTGSIGFRCAR